MLNPHLDELAQARTRFKGVILALPEDWFLKRMDDWCPRDICAHLTGWNHYILEGCRAIRAGQAPFYHADALNDYRNINAEFVSRYASVDRQAILAELDASLEPLLEYLGELAPEDWEAEGGIPYHRGGSLTIAREVESLARDYRQHAAEVEAAANPKRL